MSDELDVRQWREAALSRLRELEAERDTAIVARDKWADYACRIARELGQAEDDLALQANFAAVYRDELRGVADARDAETARADRAEAELAPLRDCRDQWVADANARADREAALRQIAEADADRLAEVAEHSYDCPGVAVRAACICGVHEALEAHRVAAQKGCEQAMGDSIDWKGRAREQLLRAERAEAREQADES